MKRKELSDLVGSASGFVKGAIYSPLIATLPGCNAEDERSFLIGSLIAIGTIVAGGVYAAIRGTSDNQRSSTDSRRYSSNSGRDQDRRYAGKGRESTPGYSSSDMDYIPLIMPDATHWGGGDDGGHHGGHDSGSYDGGDFGGGDCGGGDCGGGGD